MRGYTWTLIAAALCIGTTMSMSTPLPEAMIEARFLKRGDVSSGTIMFNGDHEGGNCIVDHSDNPGAQVGFGPCNDPAAQWTFTNGDHYDIGGQRFYWVGNIQNGKKGRCLTVAQTPDKTQSTDEHIAPANKNSWKIVTTKCGDGDDNAKKRQQWFVGYADGDHTKGAFMRVADRTAVDCGMPGINGWGDGYNFATYSGKDDKGMIVGICENPDKNVPGWKLKIDDKQYD